MRRERGAALLLVLLLIALLSVLVLEFQRAARVDIRAAENLHDDLQAHALLRSGSDLAEQVLVIYSKNSVAAMKAAAGEIKGGEFLWKFLFEEEPFDVPVPTMAVEATLSLRAQLHDLYGRFPLGALEGQNVEPRRAVFKYYLAHVKEYLLKQENKALDGVDTDTVAEYIFTYLDQFSAAKKPMEHLTELYQVKGLTPDVVKAISPFLDARSEWQFNVNARCVPLIMTMQAKTVEEASDDRVALREDPVPEPANIPNRKELVGINPEFSTALATKTSRVEVLLESAVNGGRRRARAIFEKPATSKSGGETRFQLVEWAEGWIEQDIAAEPLLGATSTVSSTTGGTPSIGGAGMPLGGPVPVGVALPTQVPKK